MDSPGESFTGRVLQQRPFDPRRTAILLIGGDKTGNDRFYEEMIPIADALYDQHIDALKAEGLIRK